jgi:hypothetical protein
MSADCVTGVIMALHLLHVPSTTSSKLQLKLVAAYEDGSVALYMFSAKDRQTSVEGVGWDRIWTSKIHKESSKAYLSSCFVWLMIFFTQSWRWPYHQLH